MPPSAADLSPDRWPAVLMGLLAVAVVATLAAAPLPHLDSDAALYGSIARRMLRTGEWLTLRYDVLPDWIVPKPPLTFWLIAVSFRLGGVTNAALRLWHLGLSLALGWAVYRLVRLDAGRATAWLGALLTLTFAQVFYYSMAPQQDVPLALFLALAFDGYLRWRRDGRTRRALAAAAALALAVLSKGLVAVAAFAAVVVVDLALAAWRPVGALRWRWDGVAAGLALFLGLAAPWFVLGAVRQGPPFVHTFLLGEVGLDRFLHPYLGPGVGSRSSLALATAYVWLLVLGMLPWTGLLPVALREGARVVRTGPPSVRFCAVWLAVYFLLLTVSGGDRIIRYLLPCYPPLAVLAARGLDRACAAPRQLRAAALVSLGVGLPVLGAAVWLLQRAAGREAAVYLPLVRPSLLLLGAAVVAFAVLGLLRRPRLAVGATALVALLSYALTYAMLARRWEPLWPWPAMAAAVRQAAGRGAEVYVVGSSGAETNFAAYWFDAPVHPADEEALMQAWCCRPVVALLSPQAAERLLPRLRPRVLLQTPLGWTLVARGGDGRPGIVPAAPAGHCTEKSVIKVCD